MIAPAINEHAVVLHRRPFRESSMMLDLLTSNYGRVKCILHGRGKNRVNVTSFVEYGTSWRGRTDLVTITNCEPLRSFDFAGKTLFSGFYLNELILRAVVPGMIVDGLYEAYLTALQAFQSKDDVEPVLRTFEKGLLRGLGYEVELEHELNQRIPIREDRIYEYLPSMGFKLSDSLSDTTHQGSTLLAMSRNDYSESQTRRAAKRIFRQALRQHIGDQPLKSRELFQSSEIEQPSTLAGTS